ncbi:MAG: helix-turn-helix domain-containing protein [Sellimonas sp.]|uniref:helix-turn-helix domain-containing protein n=1 Tax=Sellimonas sp. TaxID=2021466 RepID=UPI0039A0B927
MPIENLRITIQNGRSIWQKQDEKPPLKNAKKIVTYCIEHNRDYKGTAALYDVSYSQVYFWVKKYDTAGKTGLTDRRGRLKTDDEVVELLKKVKEFEGM